MKKTFENILAILFIISMPIIFAWAIVDGLDRQNKQVEKHCGHLQGYEFGACSMKYYR